MVFLNLGLVLEHDLDPLDGVEHGGVVPGAEGPTRPR
jgi:hypothetical protein